VPTRLNSGNITIGALRSFAASKANRRTAARLTSAIDLILRLARRQKLLNRILRVTPSTADRFAREPLLDVDVELRLAYAENRSRLSLPDPRILRRQELSQHLFDPLQSRPVAHC
jgi:hypothetical protein